METAMLDPQTHLIESKKLQLHSFDYLDPSWKSVTSSHQPSIRLALALLHPRIIISSSLSLLSWFVRIVSLYHPLLKQELRHPPLYHSRG